MGVNSNTIARTEADMSQHNNQQPPEWPVKLLRFFVKDEYLEEIEGDMEELFLSNIEQTSPGRARLLYTLEMVKLLLRPALLKNFRTIPTSKLSVSQICKHESGFLFEERVVRGLLRAFSSRV